MGIKFLEINAEPQIPIFLPYQYHQTSPWASESSNSSDLKHFPQMYSYTFTLLLRTGIFAMPMVLKACLGGNTMFFVNLTSLSILCIMGSSPSPANCNCLTITLHPTNPLFHALLNEHDSCLVAKSNTSSMCRVPIIMGTL